jgi:hypothetical protein
MNIQIAELMNLLNRAAAALDDPKSLNDLELEELSEDCQVMSDMLEEAEITYIKLLDN